MQDGRNMGELTDKKRITSEPWHTKPIGKALAIIYNKVIFI